MLEIKNKAFFSLSIRGASVISEKLNPVAGNDSPLLVSRISVLFKIEDGKLRYYNMATPQEVKLDLYTKD